MLVRRSFLLLYCLVALLALASGSPIFAQRTPSSALPLPDVTGSEIAAPTVQIIRLDFNPTGSGRCEVTLTPWPEQAKQAVERAAAIWSTLLNGSQPIVIDVCWSTFLNQDGTPNLGLLANCGSRTGAFVNFPGAPLADTDYPLPLANQLGNTDLNGSDPEMQCRFNASRTDWHTSVDGIVPADQFDLVTVALHEIGHGLGFEGSLTWDDGDDSEIECNNTLGVGCYAQIPAVYDRFVQTTRGKGILTFENNSTALGDALIGDALVFEGVNAKVANNGIAPRLHAPTSWRMGSSYVHLREDTFQEGDSRLMTPNTESGIAIHHPGVVALGMLKDMGWEIYDLSRAYVDAGNSGMENGGVLHPFNTALEGISAVPAGGRVLFFAGDYHENLTISRPMRLESIQGIVRIGR